MNRSSCIDTSIPQPIAAMKFRLLVAFLLFGLSYLLLSAYFLVTTFRAARSSDDDSKSFDYQEPHPNPIFKLVQTNG